MSTGVRTKSAIGALQQAIAENPPERAGTGPKRDSMSSPSMTNLLPKPVWYYNSRYPNETYRCPSDPNQKDPETFSFLNGQFCATKEWQQDILDKQPHVFPEDVGVEALDPCPECGYRTGSSRDYQAHMRSHL